ncbi:hypothetical protein C8J57DRAFT_1047033 [Mycena rebaudengoi]|nr:hypothetical protein C8J57DRAFT_1047033 [Mycena rebaudengoi]
MSASASSGPRQEDQKPATNVINNHITKHSTNLDLSPLLNAFNAFVTSTRQCTYPQLIVTCRGQRRAFSRASLKSMGHKQVAELFVSRFAQPEDWLEVDTPANSGWMSMPYKSRRHPPEVDFIATFCRESVEDGGPRAGPVALDTSGWADNINNVRELEVVFTKSRQ